MKKYKEYIKDRRFFIWDYQIHEWSNFNKFHLVAFEEMVKNGEGIIDKIIDKYGSSRENIELGLYTEYNYIRGILQDDLLTCNGSFKSLDDKKNIKILYKYAIEHKVRLIRFLDEKHKLIKEFPIDYRESFLEFNGNVRYWMQEYLKDKSYKRIK
jgi:hypothetical protein